MISTASSAVATRAASPTTTPSAWAPAGCRFRPAPAAAPTRAAAPRSANSSMAGCSSSTKTAVWPCFRRPARPSSCGRAAPPVPSAAVPRAPARPPRSLSASRRSDPDGGRSLPPPRNRPLRHRAAPVGHLPRRRPRIPGAPPFHVAAAPSRRRPGGDDIFTEQLERHFGQRHGRFGLARAESLRKTLVNARERLRMIGNRGPSRAGTPRTPSRSHAPMAQCSSWKWGEAIVRHGRTAEAYMPDFGTSAATATRGSEPVFSSQCVTSVPTGQLSPA